jgi:3-oxoacyl-[acyl-carrier protein] reductase
MLDIEGKVAVVTGGSRGIGAAAAIQLASAGANVAILYSRRRPEALAVVRKLKSYGVGGLAVRCRVESHADCRSVTAQIVKKLGRIDILVNSAGIWEGGRVESLTPAMWAKTIGINLTGTFNMCNVVIPDMKRKRFGRIINVSSTAGQRGEAFHSHYAASKGGIIAFTKSVAVELIPFGIRVNCVAPGWVRTDMVSHVLNKPSEKREILRSIPRGVLASPDEIAGSILFLASGLANHVVGEVLNVNGGSVLCG